jgi:integrase
MGCRSSVSARWCINHSQRLGLGALFRSSGPCLRAFLLRLLAACPQSAARTALGLSGDFVLHSLRHTMLNRLGEASVDAFTIMRIAGHSSITVSQHYVHPSPEAVEATFERLQGQSNDRQEKRKQAKSGSGGRKRSLPPKLRAIP